MLPPQLDTRLQQILGDDYTAVMNAFRSDRRGSFRINTLSGDPSQVLGEFQEKWLIVMTIPWWDGVYTFDREQEYAIKGTRAFYEGKIYLQSLSSLLPVLVLDPPKRSTLLDVCAAPGSKTTQMAASTENTSMIVALEQNQIRYEKLLYNIRLQGATSVVGKKMDARRYLTEADIYFDAILLDAPCSAEGRIDLRNEKTHGFWSLENIEKKAELQKELLSLALDRLKKGGELVYSTCTLAPEENEGVVSSLLISRSDIELLPIALPEVIASCVRDGITGFDEQDFPSEITLTKRILPSPLTEWFYIMKCRKK